MELTGTVQPQMSSNFSNASKPNVPLLDSRKMPTARETLQRNKEILHYESIKVESLGFGDFENDTSPTKISFEQKVSRKVSKKFRKSNVDSIGSQEQGANNDYVVRFNSTQQNFDRELL